MIQDDVAWEKVLKRAELHGIGPLVYFNLLRSGVGGRVPERILKQFEGLYYWTSVHNEDLYERLQAALTLLSQKRILVIVLKGAALAALVYPKRGLRAMNDLDILVPLQQLTTADRLLQTLGYEHEDTGDGRGESWYRNQHHHLNPHRSRDRRFTIELHHNIVPPTAPIQPPIEDLWRRARPAEIASVSTYVLGPEDLLLHLCLHLSTDLGRDGTRLRTICDIAEALGRNQEQVHWAQVLESARSCGMMKHLYYVLWIVQHTVAAQIPTEVVNELIHAVRPGVFEQLVLKFLMLRSVLGQGQAIVHIPPWLLTTVCTEMLASRSTWRSLRIIGRTLWTGYVHSAQQRASRSRFPDSFYVVFIHSGWLVRRAAARLLRKATDRDGVRY